ncbi:hypothetical protein ACFL9T_22650 [Thermodesulfobacteriota bacterium]
MKIGIVGARKYQDKQSVIDLVNTIPADNQIITSGCKGVCTWVKEAVEERGMEVILFEPDLSDILAWFDVPKRYYRRNKEMVEACDILHAFLSAEDGYKGGTRFEIEYAIRLVIPVQIHWENGFSQWIFQYFFPFIERKQPFSLSWQEFFHKTDLEVQGV